MNMDCIVDFRRCIDKGLERAYIENDDRDFGIHLYSAPVITLLNNPGRAFREMVVGAFVSAYKVVLFISGLFLNLIHFGSDCYKGNPLKEKITEIGLDFEGIVRNTIRMVPILGPFVGEIFDGVIYGILNLSAAYSKGVILKNIKKLEAELKEIDTAKPLANDKFKEVLEELIQFVENSVILFKAESKTAREVTERINYIKEDPTKKKEDAYTLMFWYQRILSQWLSRVHEEVTRPQNEKVDTKKINGIYDFIFTSAHNLGAFIDAILDGRKDLSSYPITDGHILSFYKTVLEVEIFVRENELSFAKIGKLPTEQVDCKT